ncbi:hypothetical protein HF668_04105 [Acidithiobacillus ferridurans]|uniref:hypothetical protein n=1 Tax=Acidithiobacillus ferridurans TaxID=1232575 RepID=UPI001C07251F|nr:hypothetical protein [Acidithiobacillus ferridurans]MBU2804352.1 hypothetical protein [Acidithiobacillus ferridurans]
MGGNLGVTMFIDQEELASLVQDIKSGVWWKYGEALATIRFCILRGLPTPPEFKVPHFRGELRDKSDAERALVALAMAKKMALLQAEHNAQAVPGFVPESA